MMWFNNYINSKGEITLPIDKAIDILQSGGDINKFVLEDCNDVTKYNKLSQKKISTKHNDLKWMIPKKYLDIDIYNFFRQFNLELSQQNRVDYELAVYNKKGLLIILKLMIYLVDVMRENKIIWGVGRGSSVSSYLLYLIGVHKVDSLKYNLDLKEFLK